MGIISRIRTEGFALLAPRPPKRPEDSRSRAGRNLPAAMATAFVALGIVALSLMFDSFVFVLLASIAFCIGIWEAAGAFLTRKITIPVIALMLSTLLMGAATYGAGIAAGFATFCVAAFVVALWRLFSPRPHAMVDAVAGVFTLGWISMGGMFAIALAAPELGPWCVATLILMPAASDTGGYAVGVLFGKHPIAASISPKKSWEGFVGSVLLSFLAAWLLVHYVLGLEWGWVVLFALVTPVLATLGDFSESLLKRDFGVKDMGSMFPGHGGMLDRIDAMLLCAPAFYLMFAIAFHVL